MAPINQTGTQGRRTDQTRGISRTSAVVGPWMEDQWIFVHLLHLYLILLNLESPANLGRWLLHWTFSCFADFRTCWVKPVLKFSLRLRDAQYLMIGFTWLMNTDHTWAIKMIHQMTGCCFPSLHENKAVAVSTLWSGGKGRLSIIQDWLIRTMLEGNLVSVQLLNTLGKFINKLSCGKRVMQPEKEKVILPFSIFTATVLHVDSLSIPKAEASTTFPKAPCPRVLPVRQTRGLDWMSERGYMRLPGPGEPYIKPETCQRWYGPVIKTTCGGSDHLAGPPQGIYGAVKTAWQQRVADK